MSEATITLTDIDELQQALYGERGEEQKRIAEVGLAWVMLMLHKNRDYGGAIWKPPALLPMLRASDAIRVRMGDKIERLKSLWAGNIPEVSDESIDDTIRDLGAYCLLYLARPNDT